MAGKPFQLPTDPGEALELATDARAALAQRNTQQAAIQAAWELPAPPAAGQAETITVTKLRSQHAKMAALLAGKPFTTQFVPEDDSPQSRDRAERLSALCRRLYDEWALRYQDGVRNALYYDEHSFGLLRGACCSRLLLDPADPDGFIWDYALLDAATVYPRGTGRRPLYVARIIQEPVSDVLAQWGDDAQTAVGSRGLQEPVTLVELYTNDQLAVLADGAWLKPPTPHQLGFNPVTMVTFTGAPYRATEQSQNWQQYAYATMLDVLLPVHKDTQALATIARTLTAKAAAPPSTLYTNAQASINDIPMGPNERAVRPLGDVLQRDNPSGEAIALSNLMLQYLQKEADEIGLSGAVFGVLPATSGYERNEARGSATDILRPHTESMTRYYRIVFGKALRLFADHAAAPVRVQQLGAQGPTFNAYVQPDEARGTQMRLLIRFPSLDTPDRTANAQIAAILAQQGLASKPWIRENLIEMDEPGRERWRVLEDAFYADPQVGHLLYLNHLRNQPNPDPLVPRLAELLFQKAWREFQLFVAPTPPPQIGGAQPPVPGGGVPSVPGPPQPPNSVLPDELGTSAGAGPNGALPGPVPPPGAGLNLGAIPPL